MAGTRVVVFVIKDDEASGASVRRKLGAAAKPESPWRWPPRELRHTRQALAFVPSIMRSAVCG
jgi:hypothetical protein